MRVGTGLRAAALLGLVALAMGCGFWWQAGTGGPRVAPLSEPAPAAVEESGLASVIPASPSGDDSGAGAASITVHVAGAVATPGVVQVPPGSRLHDAISAAGGATATADPDRLNLAAVLEDGQKVFVPARGEPDPSGASGAGAGGPASGTGGAGSAGSAGQGADGRKINLNTAGLEELGTLPRVGPVLAQRIVDWRRQHGRFKTVQELDAVDGIGPKLLEALLPLVSV
ncbi:helix-hairpin-helix domain-containing protein [Arthrobacter sp. PM3]|uniref:helix-hairpin-helix domain-containing protein n=1 Tax=Arthrobacter sp. PM3 TaxID=2017685 RepID=UPI0021C29FAA|nr:helix-hairpin-helix domain-containing protein [Arthrobacter sp. PM3]